MKKQVLKAIDKLEGLDGTTVNEISNETGISKRETRKIFYELYKEDKIYQPVKGRFKHLGF